MIFESLESFDLYIDELEKRAMEINGELEAARNYRPYVAKREPGPAKAPVDAQPPLIKTDRDNGGYGVLMRGVREAIAACPNEYTVYNVEQKLIEAGVFVERTAISQALSRMSAAKEIRLLKKGRGRSPSTFTKEPASD